MYNCFRKIYTYEKSGDDQDENLQAAGFGMGHIRADRE